MAYDIGVRKELNSRGVANDLIGYDQNTGYVTVDGQDFLKPQKNFQGTTFTDRPTFNQAYSTYEKSLQPQTTPGTVTTSSGNMQPTQLTPQPTLADQQINDLISNIMNQMNNPQKFNPYASPEFAANEARSNRAAQQGIRAAQESLGSAGFGRSTVLGERAQGIQNDQEDFLRTQVIPSIIAQNEQRKQQELANQMALLNPLINRSQFAQDLALREGQLTGNYIPNEAQSIIDNILELKRQAEMPGVAGQQLQGLSSQADVYRNQLRSMGIDPSFIGADVNANTALQNRTDIGIPTLAGQNQAFNQGVAMAELTGFLPDGTPTNAQQQLQLENEWTVADRTGQITPTLAQLYGIPVGTPTQAAKQFAQQLAISQQNANTSATSTANSNTNARINQLMEVWQNTGSAPAGLESLGVQEGTPLPQEPLEPLEPTSNEVTSEYVTNLDQLPPEQQRKALEDERATIIKDIGPSGYRFLVDLYIDDESIANKLLEEITAE